jgi:hypothetical protein
LRWLATLNRHTWRFRSGCQDGYLSLSRKTKTSFVDIQLMISEMYSPIRALKKAHFETVCRVCLLPPLQPTIGFPIPGDLVPVHRCRGNVSLKDRPDGCHNNGALATARVRLLDVHSAGALTEGNRDTTIGGDAHARQQRVGPAYSAHQPAETRLFCDAI